MKNTDLSEGTDRGPDFFVSGGGSKGKGAWGLPHRTPANNPQHRRPSPAALFSVARAGVSAPGGRDGGICCFDRSLFAARVCSAKRFILVPLALNPRQLVGGGWVISTCACTHALDSTLSLQISDLRIFNFAISENRIRPLPCHQQGLYQQRQMRGQVSYRDPPPIPLKSATQRVRVGWGARGR